MDVEAQGNISTNITGLREISISDITQMVVEIIFMIFICTVNALTLATVCRNRILWTVPNMYIVSLAIADFLTGLSLSYQMVFHVPQIKAVFDQNKYLCLFRHVIIFVMLAASILNMILIAVDRWACITFPFQHERLVTIPRVGMLITVAWVISVFIGTIPLYNNNWKPNVSCVFFKVLTMEYQLFVQGVFFLVSSFIVAVCYGHVFRIAKRQRESILKLTRLNYTVANDTNIAKFKRDFDLVNMFCVVFGVFFVCYAPAFIFVTVAYTVGIKESVNSFTIPLLVMNSGMNFIIYVLKNTTFRSALKITCLNCRPSTVAAM